MRTARLLALTVIVVALVALTSWWAGAPAARDDTVLDHVVPAAGTDASLSSTWYCAAGGAGAPEPAAHQVLLSNPTGAIAPARLSAFGAEGQVGSFATEVNPGEVAAIDVNESFGTVGLSVMVESESGALVVEHRLGTPTAVDSVPCATTSSGAWFFPSQSTLRGATAQLVLFNPFSGDASVDITFATSDGVRIPGEWAGLVVRAGSSRVVDLSQFASVRDQFSVSVKARSGQLIAETAQYFDVQDDETLGLARTSGMQLQVGIPQARTEWVLATGFTGSGVREKVVVYNPSREAAAVIVQVTPYGGASMPPEPFELDVPGGRFAVVDLSAETRVPAEGFHAIQVESDGTPVVVGRSIQLNGEATAPADPATGVRPAETLGATLGTGTPRPTTRWIVPALVTGPDEQPMVFVHNPGTGIATVRMQALAGTEERISVVSGLEVAPGDSRWVAVGTPEGAPELLEVANRTILVEATEPVVVERTITFAGADDVSVALAVPVTR
ncbi:MAG: DUF5719 family protein [Microthrixaceae bacterium]